jgi:trehalose 2-sulfotransferase
MPNKIAEAFPDGYTITSKTLKGIRRDTRLYVIFILWRTGSTWLMEMAANSGALGTPQEWFGENWIHTDELAMGCRPPKVAGTKSADEYVRLTVANYRSVRGIMGLQLSSYQAECLCTMLEDPAEAIGLATPFYLRRRNIVAQAISLYRSNKTGYFHTYQEAERHGRFGSVDYDADAIQLSCEQIVAGELFFEDMFKRMKISPLCFTYEDIVVDPEHLLNWLARNVDPGISARIEACSEKLTKLGGPASLKWEQRFRAERTEYLTGVEQRRPPVSSDVPTSMMMSRFFRRLGVTFKKRRLSRASRIART